MEYVLRGIYLAHHGALPVCIERVIHLETRVWGSKFSSVFWTQRNNSCPVIKNMLERLNIPCRYWVFITIRSEEILVVRPDCNNPYRVILDRLASKNLDYKLTTDLKNVAPYSIVAKDLKVNF